MRSTSWVLAALTGIAVSAFAAPAGALTPNSSTGIRAAAESVDPLASVHCRPFKHRSYNHGWGHGCHGGGFGVSVHRRGFVEEREGVRRGRVSIHEREGVRGRVGIHERSTTRSETTVRSRESTSPRGEVRTGTSRSSTTGKTGTTGKTPVGTSGGGGTGGGGTTGQSSGQR